MLLCFSEKKIFILAGSPVDMEAGKAHLKYQEELPLTVRYISSHQSMIWHHNSSFCMLHNSAAPVAVARVMYTDFS